MDGGGEEETQIENKYFMSSVKAFVSREKNGSEKNGLAELLRLQY